MLFAVYIIFAQLSCGLFTIISFRLCICMHVFAFVMHFCICMYLCMYQMICIVSFKNLLKFTRLAVSLLGVCISDFLLTVCG